MGKEREVLEDEAGAPALGRHVRPLPETGRPATAHVARRLALDPGGDAEKRRLAASRRAEEAGDLAGSSRSETSLRTGTPP